jgi:hypothetical protein
MAPGAATLDGARYDRMTARDQNLHGPAKRPGMARSALKCPPTGIGDPDTADKLAASLLALCCCKSGADEAH